MRLRLFLPLVAFCGLLTGGADVGSPFRLYIDGEERTANLDPSSVEITRQLHGRTNKASLAVYQDRQSGYYNQPSTLPGVKGWWHMDEASGDLVDASGNGHTLADTGSPTYRKRTIAPGYGGKSIRFDGVDDAFSSTAATLKPSGNFSIGMWIKLPIGDVMSGSWRVLMANAAGVGSGHWEVFIYNPGSYFLSMEVRESVAEGSSSDLMGVLLPQAIANGKRHFVVATYTAATRTFRAYVDGELAGTDTTTIDYGVGGGDMILGSDNISGGGVNWFKGRMQEAFISHEVLSAAVIQTLYGQGRAGFEHIQLNERSRIEIKTEDGSRHRFGGYAIEVYPIAEGALGAGWEAACVGWENDLETISVDSYTGVNKRTDSIISEIFAADSRLSAYDLSRVRTGKVYKGVFRVRDRFVSDILDELAEVDGDEWWIDANGTDLYKQRFNKTKTAAVRVSDVTADIDDVDEVFSYYGFDYSRDFSHPVSRVIIRGATTYDDWNPRTFGTLSQYGSNNAYRLDLGGLVPRESESDIIVQVNEGSATSPSWSGNLAVGYANKDTLVGDGGDKDVLIQYIRKDYDRLIFDEGVAPRLQSYNAFRIYGRTAHKTRVVIKDDAAKTRLGGRHYDAYIEDERITSPEAARTFAERFIKERSRQLEQMSFWVDFDPDDPDTLVEIGDLLHVANSRHGIDTFDDNLDGYRVQEIKSVMDPFGNGQHHALTVGTYKPTPDDLLKQLVKRSRKMSDIEEDEQEVEMVLTGWAGDAQDEDDVMTIRDTEVVVTPA